MLDVSYTSRFKKDARRMRKQGKDLSKLDELILLLRKGEALPVKVKDRGLSGSYFGHRECHIEPDWLLIYRIEQDVLTLTAVRTASHADLFGL